MTISGCPRSLQATSRRAGSRSTILSLVTVAGVLVAAILGLRPGSSRTRWTKRPAADLSKPPVAIAARAKRRTRGRAVPSSAFKLQGLPALVTDTVNGHFDRAITGLPVVTPLMSRRDGAVPPDGAGAKERVEQFQTTPEKMMDSTQVERPLRPIG